VSAPEPRQAASLRSAERFARRLGQSRRLSWQLRVKRVLDILGSLLLLLLLAPVILAAAVLVRATSPGPAFYLDLRRGWQGRAFTCFKLRSMRQNGDAILARQGLSNLGEEGRLLIFKDDPRITPVGRIMRKLSIDELPQLLNVLRGDMSLIGPRPLTVSMLTGYDAIDAARSVVRPGLTGLWQVRNRMKNASVLDMVRDDMAYLDGFGLLLDLRIACLTVPRMIEPSPRADSDDGLTPAAEQRS